MTKGQKQALRAIRLAAAALRKRVLESNEVRECVEVRADFHISCSRYDRGWFRYGNGPRQYLPMQMDRQFYEPLWLTDKPARDRQIARYKATLAGERAT